MSLKSINAFAPASISCIFKSAWRKDPRWSGSYGLGFTVDEGVVVTVSKSQKTEIFFNKEKIVLPTVATVIKNLTKQPLSINIASTLPLGCGFGLSGASALATAYAANKLLELKKTKKALAVIAHTAEVENKTGLGTVVNQYYGGFLVKFVPSSHFIVKRLPIVNVPVYCRYFSPLLTKGILINKSLINRIDKVGTDALNSMRKLMSKKDAITFSAVIAIAKTYIDESGLLREQKSIDTIAAIEKKGGNASMMIFGNAVYSDIPFPGAIKLTISDKGAHLL